MSSILDQIRASKLPSNMMQFAARGAMQVPPAENIEILVYLAKHNKIFGELARLTLAGWDEKACLAAASDPQTPREVLDYFISPDNLRPKLLPALLENPSVPESEIAKLARSAMRDTIEVMLKSARAVSLAGVVAMLKINPYLKKEEVAALSKTATPAAPTPSSEQPAPMAPTPAPEQPEPNAELAAPTVPIDASASLAPPVLADLPNDPEHEEAVATYMKEHGPEIEAEGDKPFKSIGGALELLREDDFAGAHTAPAPAVDPGAAAEAAANEAPTPVVPAAKKPVPATPVRMNAMQKINTLDVKGRIQLALKGNKEERSLLIRDGTKVVALAVLEAPKLSDGEVEKFASQKNVLEAVLRQIPLKRRFMKNYIVVRNLCANPRTPIDLGLGLMKNLLAADLKNISGNKEVSETIRKLALKMFKQKVDAANKK
jgi:hypothetical protein